VLHTYCGDRATVAQAHWATGRGRSLRPWYLLLSSTGYRLQTPNLIEQILDFLVRWVEG